MDSSGPRGLSQSTFVSESGAFGRLEPVVAIRTPTRVSRSHAWVARLVGGGKRETLRMSSLPTLPTSSLATLTLFGPGNSGDLRVAMTSSGHFTSWATTLPPVPTLSNGHSDPTRLTVPVSPLRSSPNLTAPSLQPRFPTDVVDSRHARSVDSRHARSVDSSIAPIRERKDLSGTGTSTFERAHRPTYEAQNYETSEGDAQERTVPFFKCVRGDCPGIREMSVNSTHEREGFATGCKHRASAAISDTTSEGTPMTLPEVSLWTTPLHRAGNRASALKPSYTEYGESAFRSSLDPLAGVAGPFLRSPSAGHVPLLMRESDGSIQISIAPQETIDSITTHASPQPGARGEAGEDLLCSSPSPRRSLSSSATHLKSLSSRHRSQRFTSTRLLQLPSPSLSYRIASGPGSPPLLLLDSRGGADGPKLEDPTIFEDAEVKRDGLVGEPTHAAFSPSAFLSPRLSDVASKPSEQHSKSPIRQRHFDLNRREEGESAPHFLDLSPARAEQFVKNRDSGNFLVEARAWTPLLSP